MTQSFDPARTKPRRRGAPLLLLGILVVGWVSARAAVWENPFPAQLQSASPAMPDLMAETGASGASLDAGGIGARQTMPSDGLVAEVPALPNANRNAPDRRSRVSAWTRPRTLHSGSRSQSHSDQPVGDETHTLASSGANAQVQRPGRGGVLSSDTRSASGVPRAAPPALPDSAISSPSTNRDRWSFDAFTFYRAGSGSEAVSAGRVAIYGASQSSARLQYRFAPGSRQDLRAFVRAYQAHVSGGESELTAGLSMRPVPSLPVRAFGEVRLTDTALFGRTIRPAAYAVTEIAPVSLPLDAALELYGGAGYVGGKASTFFADGQAVGMREVAKVNPGGERSVRISFGGGAWGGVQRDAGRLDIGPTMRFDFDLGKVPARVSVDWRERVAGDAEPGSGVAATVSTQF